MEEKLHSLGTVVYLQEGTQKIMIVGRGVTYKDETDGGKEVYVDYLGCPFPQGINPEESMFFNRENVDQVVFEGLVDEDEERFIKVYKEWEQTITVPKKIIE